MSDVVHVIDDDEAMRESLDFLLDASGFRPHTYAAAADFLAVADTAEPGCIVTDIRMPGLGGEVMKKLGATVVLVPGGEIFQALQSGTVDGAEWIGPYNDLALGFYQVCRYYYSPGYHEPGPCLQLMINEQAWKSLTPELQAIVRTAADAATRDMLAEYNARSGPALRSLRRLERQALLGGLGDLVTHIDRQGLVRRDAGTPGDEGGGQPQQGRRRGQGGAAFAPTGQAFAIGVKGIAGQQHVVRRRGDILWCAHLQGRHSLPPAPRPGHMAIGGAVDLVHAGVQQGPHRQIGI